VSYERLARTPVQWPSPPSDAGRSDDDGRNPIRYLNDGVSQQLLERPDGTRPRLAFATKSGRAVFFARPHMDAREMPDDDYPFVLNTGRLQHQWHTLTKTGRVHKLNKLNPGPFLEIHPDDAARLSIVDGDSLEIASRRGRAILPASVSDRVQPGNLFAPFHWNDTYGEYLAVNAVTNDAVDALSFQPEFKVSAVALTRLATRIPVVPAEQPAPSVEGPGAAGEVAGSSTGVILTGLGTAPSGPPDLAPEQESYLQGLLWAHDRLLTGEPAVLPESAPFDDNARAWINGMLAGFHRTPRTQARPASVAAKPKVSVLWASQTGNAEEHALDLAEQLRGIGLDADLVAMDDYDVRRLPDDGPVLLVSSTFGDGDSPDNGEAFWSALAVDDAPRLDGLRYAVLAFGDPSYDDFCGHGRRLDARIAELGGQRLVDRADCEPGDGTSAQAWFERVAALLTPADPVAPVAGVAQRPAPTP
jgi:sulfite reductase (NADPH) flavoprotein alpha-component